MQCHLCLMRLALPTSLDITNYDPIKNASEGSSDACLGSSKWGRSGEHF